MKQDCQQEVNDSFLNGLEQLFKPIVNIIPCISAILIFISYCGLSAYYKSFDINIGDYLMLQDIVPFFIPSADLLFFCLLFGAAGYSLVRIVALARSGKAVAALVLIASICLLVITTMYIHQEFFPKATLFQTIGVVGIVVAMFITIFSFNISRALQWVLVFTLQTIIINYVRGDYSHKYPRQQILFVYNGNRTVRSSKDTIYVGQTSTLLFLYVNGSGTVLIFQKDKIQDLAFQRNKLETVPAVVGVPTNH